MANIQYATSPINRKGTSAKEKLNQTLLPFTFVLSLGCNVLNTKKSPEEAVYIHPT
jgi:hypothetical protein